MIVKKNMAKKMLVLSLSAILTLGMTVSAAESVEMVEADTIASNGSTYDYALSAVKVCATDDKSQYDFGFEETIEIDGLSYCLDTVEYDQVNMYEKEYGTDEIEYTITIEETVLGEDKDSFKADDTVTRAGHDYVYSDISFEETSSETIPMYKYLDTEVLQGVLIVENYPETLPYDYEGKMYDLKYSDYEVLSSGWHDGFYLYGTIYDYDAATYQVGDIIIENNGKEFDLDPRNYVDFLEGLDVPTDIYKINSVSYNGEPYTDANGIICRDYVMSVQMNGTKYRLNYKYDLVKKEYKATITYNLTETEATYIDSLKNSYEVTATAYYTLKEEGFAGLSTPIKIAIGFGIVIGLAAIITLIVYIARGGRRRTEDMNKRELKDEFKNI